MESAAVIRKASHAGSWYSENGAKLAKELSSYLAKAEKTLPAGSLLRAIIGPHAGYYYSGPTAAWAYINIDPDAYKRVILLGPAHHKYIDGCALSRCTEYETPLGNISIDRATTEALYAKGGFKYFSKGDDEDEHSLEMHLPYIK